MLDVTPLAVAFISACGAVIAAYLAYANGQKTKKRVESMPTDLVKEFSKLNPGVDTVEKVIELLYTEIGRLTDSNKALNARIDSLLNERTELLDEISKLKASLDEHQRKLNYLETRIKNAINNGDKENGV